ncbi:PEBP-like protein [Paraphaeosphaeria sporulosa]|uniref:PEBP-like protein n=1 Tax=Paraphaeosphaeria sporulosa TaxID=1460663 RepID=A0A177CC06_9PLEO|nr:PEBP-like protein [Paraphaeosphaeria sporulosa]OAG04731.1 PEBP-like protein [Paraphaeosphaeria sporulosa]
MHFSKGLVVAAAVGIAQAQTPKGFTPAAKAQLDVIFNSTKVSTPGELLSKAATASQPQLALPSSAVSSNETYVFVMLDLDVPAASGNSSRRVLLHAMNTGFKATKQSIAGGNVLLASSEKGPATYIGPSPPASDTIAHRYTQLLFKQPSTLKASASDFSNTQARIGFDIAGFAKQNGLGEPVAGNFFMVDGRASGAAAATGTRGAGGARQTGGGGGRGNGTSPRKLSPVVCV